MILEAIGAIIIFLETLMIIGSRLPDKYDICAIPILIFTMLFYLIFNNGVRLLLLLIFTLISAYLAKNYDENQDDNNNNSNYNQNTSYNNNTNRTYRFNNNNNYNNNRYNNNYYDHIMDEYSPKEKIKLPSNPKPTHTNPFKDNVNLHKKFPYKGKKTNINTADYNQLCTLPHIGDNRAKRIIEYRSNKKIESINELAFVASLAKTEANDLTERVIYNTETVNNSDNSDETLNRILDEIRNERAELKKERDELDKRIEEKLNVPYEDTNPQQDNDNNQDIPREFTVIDINTATEEQLKELPSINIIKAKKIIQLRDAGVYIKSFDDLQEKLNLKDYELEQIRPLVKINIIDTSNSGRRLDL